MKDYAIAIIYVSFFAVIGFVCYVTKSSWPLLGLIFIPSFSFSNNDSESNKQEE